MSKPCGILRLALSSCILNRWDIGAFPELAEADLGSRISTTCRRGWSPGAPNSALGDSVPACGSPPGESERSLGDPFPSLR